VTALALSALAPRAALAQTAAPNAAARAAFDEGMRLAGAGNYAEGCAKLDQSERLEANVDVLIALGDCYERAGRAATAWVDFLQAATLAEHAAQADRVQTARARAAAVAPAVPKFVVTVTNAAATPGLRITRDGAPVPPDQYGVAVAADPGAYTLAATAPGHKPWQATFTVQPGGQTTEATVPVLEPLAAPIPVPLPATPPSVPTEAAATQTVPPPIQNSGSFGAQRVLAIVSGGLGLAFVGVGIAEGLHAKTKRDDARALCTGTSCRTQQGVNDTTEAVNAGNLATAGFVAGAIGILGGVALWITAPSGAEPSTRVGVGPTRLVLEQTF
jgi:hypothetical protein